MKKSLLILWSAVALAHASDDLAFPKPLKGEYSIYSGELGDEHAPTTNDRKLSIEISGPAAKDIFESRYPDAKGIQRSVENGQRLRRKGNVWCIYQPTDGYRCFLGFNLRTGDSIAGGSC